MVRHMDPTLKHSPEMYQNYLTKPVSNVPAQYKGMLKQFEHKQASVKFRHDMLVRQRNANYVNEYNRIMGVLHTNVHGLPDASLDRLKRRQSQLQDLATQSLGPGNPFKKPVPP